MTGSYVEGRELWGSQRFDADTVIIGSGASGAVVAAHLAEAGERVVVVEEGGRVDWKSYAAMRPTQSLRNLWREGGTTAVFGIGNSPLINVTMGRVVGGSSVLTGGVCFRTPDSVLDYWVKHRGLTDLAPDRVDRYFEDVERVVHVEEVPAHMRSRSTALWAEGAERRGVEVRPLRRNTSGCKGCGQCNFGCPQGAKLSVDISYLPRAVKAGATVLSDCQIDKVEMLGRRAIGVRGHLLDSGRRKRGPVTVRAKRVVLAAGAAHTPLVLWRSGIGRAPWSQVGRNMTLHPGFRMMARFDDPVRGWAGSMQSAYSESYDKDRITLVSLFVPPFALAAGIAGFGPEFMKRVHKLDHLAMFGGMIHDDAGGRVWASPVGREPIMTYRMSPQDRAAIPKLIRALAEPFIEAGATELYLPILGHPPVTPDEFRRVDLERFRATRFECSSQHPMGTCRMGTSPKNSVVDHEGRVWDTEGLYVVDGGAVPTSLGVNPQLTIMAMATRFSERMID